MTHQRHPLAFIAGVLAIVIAVGVVLIGAIVALDSDTYRAADYFRDAALAAIALAAACFALRAGDREVIATPIANDPTVR
jgi:hypothetical protein